MGVRPTYSGVVATLALFVALGGAGYAASQLPKNSVKGKQIAKNAVRSPELAKGGVRSTDVLDGSLLAEDFGAGQLPQGPPGEQGAPGEQGPQGIPGPVSAAVAGEADPTASPDAPNFPSGEAATLTTTAPGRVLVMFHLASISINCSGVGAAQPALGLRLNGTPIPGTHFLMRGDSVDQDVTIYGMTAESVPAGTHTLRIDADCPGPETVASAGAGGPSNRYAGAIVIGS